jgi:hypothetical protein
MERSLGGEPKEGWESVVETSYLMSPRHIVSNNRDDPGNPLVFDGDAIDAAAQDPLAIGKF